LVQKKKSKAKAKKTKPKTKKKAFGGYSVNFSGRTETLEEVFGKAKIPPSEMTKRIWSFVKANDLGGK